MNLLKVFLTQLSFESDNKVNEEWGLARSICQQIKTCKDFAEKDQLYKSILKIQPWWLGGRVSAS